jgi:hypothetical protein
VRGRNLAFLDQVQQRLGLWMKRHSLVVRGG